MLVVVTTRKSQWLNIMLIFADVTAACLLDVSFVQFSLVQILLQSLLGSLHFLAALTLKSLFPALCVGREGRAQHRIFLRPDLEVVYITYALVPLART